MSDTLEVDEPTVHSVYEDFWKPLLETEGVINVEQVKKELFDFWRVIQAAPKVYRYVTGDQISNLLTDADTVCRLVDEHYDQLYKDAE